MNPLNASDLGAYASGASSIVVAVATIVLARLTAKYVHLTRELLEHSREAKKPQVFVDLEFPSELAMLVIENRGGTSARDIRFAVEKDVPWLKWDPKGPGGVSGVPGVQRGISYLTPGRRLEFILGNLFGIPEGQDSEIRLQVEFRDEDGTRYQRLVVIDVAQYLHVSTGSFQDAGDKIARAIQDQTRSTQFAYTRPVR